MKNTKREWEYASGESENLTEEQMSRFKKGSIYINRTSLKKKIAELEVASTWDYTDDAEAARDGQEEMRKAILRLLDE